VKGWCTFIVHLVYNYHSSIKIEREMINIQLHHNFGTTPAHNEVGSCVWAFSLFYLKIINKI